MSKRLLYGMHVIQNYAPQGWRFVLNICKLISIIYKEATAIQTPLILCLLGGIARILEVKIATSAWLWVAVLRVPGG